MWEGQNRCLTKVRGILQLWRVQVLLYCQWHAFSTKKEHSLTENSFWKRLGKDHQLDSILAHIFFYNGRRTLSYECSQSFVSLLCCTTRVCRSRRLASMKPSYTSRPCQIANLKAGRARVHIPAFKIKWYKFAEFATDILEIVQQACMYATNGQVQLALSKLMLTNLKNIGRAKYIPCQFSTGTLYCNVVNILSRSTTLTVAIKLDEPHWESPEAKSKWDCNLRSCYLRFRNFRCLHASRIDAPLSHGERILRYKIFSRIVDYLVATKMDVRNPSLMPCVVNTSDATKLPSGHITIPNGSPQHSSNPITVWIWLGRVSSRWKGSIIRVRSWTSTDLVGRVTLRCMTSST